MSGTTDTTPAPAQEDPLVRWERLNRLVSQLQLTHEQFGHVLDRLAAEVESQRPEVRG